MKVRIKIMVGRGHALHGLPVEIDSNTSESDRFYHMYRGDAKHSDVIWAEESIGENGQTYWVDCEMSEEEVREIIREFAEHFMDKNDPKARPLKDLMQYKTLLDLKLLSTCKNFDQWAKRQETTSATEKPIKRSFIQDFLSSRLQSLGSVVPGWARAQSVYLHSSNAMKTEAERLEIFLYWLTVEQMEELAKIKSMVQQKGILMESEVRQFYERGVHISALIAEDTGRPVSEVRSLIKANKMHYTDIMHILYKVE